MALTQVATQLNFCDLPVWGGVTQLGGTILSENVQDIDVFWQVELGQPTDSVSAGFFGTAQGKYRLVYPFSEQAVIVYGEVKILDESTGIEKIYRQGDMWVVEKGTSTVWEVLSDRYIKHYFYVI